MLFKCIAKSSAFRPNSDMNEEDKKKTGEMEVKEE
jgi:hypothetical protein